MCSNSYLRVRWFHDHPDEPVVMWSELDDQRLEIRKIEVWQNGRVGFATRQQESGGTRLGTSPIPPFAEIAADSEFKPEQVTELEFEECWRTTVSPVQSQPDTLPLPTASHRG